MSVTLYIKSKKAVNNILPLVKSAIEAEITRLELALEMAIKRLKPFEKKYGVTSEHFISNLTAEDLDGRDDEYVNWAGEYKLKQRLESKLQQLREIKYGNTEVF